jgi:Hypothetical glycosyl hydrolase family 15
VSQPRLLLAAIALLSSLAATLLPGLAGSRTEPAAAGPAGPPSTLAISPLSHADVAGAGDLSRFQHVTLTPWYHQLIPQLKQKNPEIKVLAYKDMASTRSYACRSGQDDALLPAGVGYCLANARHPDWFLLDDQARRCEWAGYPGHWQMDVGHPDYQRAWLENVLPELRRHGWDGVVLDNSMVTISEPYCPGRRFPRYPTQAAYQAATRSFLAYVGPRLKAEGFLVLPNIQAHATLAGVELWRDWLQFTSGGTREYWMRWGNPGSHFGGQPWLELQEIFAEVQRQGKLFLTGTPADGPGDVRSMRYGRASFLLGWNGGAAGFGGGNWHPEWTIEIGRPTGPRYQVGSAWRRDYTEGTAIANISPSASQTVALGASYLQSDGSAVTSVTLAPLTGIVLRDREPAATQSGAAADPPKRPEPVQPSPPPAPRSPAPPTSLRRSADATASVEERSSATSHEPSRALSNWRNRPHRIRVQTRLRAKKIRFGGTFGWRTASRRG